MSVWDESPLPPPAAGTPAAPPPTGPPPTPPGNPGGGRDGEPGDGAASRRLLGVPVWLVTVAGVAICVAIYGVIALATGSDGPTAPEPIDANASDASAPSTPTPTTLTPTTVATTVPTTTVPPSTVAPTTTTAPSTATAPSTTAPPTTVASTTEAPTTAAAAPGPSISGPTTVTGSDGRSLTVTPRLDGCSVGSECLVVAFDIAGFATQPQTFVCEFASGGRYEFRFDTERVSTACSTSDVPDSIVVEVGGLRSDPVTISE